MTISVTASEELRFLHLYMPRGEPFFCAEPVSAMPNAFNRQEPAELTGLRILAPGESCSVSMGFTVELTPRA